MATRAAFANRSGGTATSTINAVTYTSNVSLTFTPNQAGADYLIIGRCESGTTVSTAADTQVRLYHDTAAVALSGDPVPKRVDAVGAFYPFFFAKKVTIAASAANQTFSIQHKIASASAGRTSECRYGTLVAIELAAADAYVDNAVGGTSASNPGTWTDSSQVHTFTPASAGDYLIIACGELSSSTATNGVQARLLCEDGTTAVGTAGMSVANSATRHTMVFVTKRTLTAVSSTFKLQHARVVSGSATSTLENVRYIALRVDGFNGEADTVDATRDTMTAATLAVLGTSHTQTLTASTDYLLIGYADYDANTIAVTYEVKATDGTTVFADSAPQVKATVGNNFTDAFADIVTGSAAKTFDWQGKSNGTATLGSDLHAFYVLTLTGVTVANPAIVFAPTQRRAQRAMPVRRARPIELVPAQVPPPASPALVLNSSQRRAVRGALVRRSHPVEVVPPQFNPPFPHAVIRAARALRGLPGGRGRRREVVPGQAAVPVNPGFVAGPSQRRAVRGWLSRRGRSAETVPPQSTPLAVVAQPRRGLRPVRRARSEVLAAPAVPVNPAFVHVPTQRRVAKALLRRGRAVAPVPGQDQPQVQGSRRLLGLVARRARRTGPLVTATVPATADPNPATATVRATGTTSTVQAPTTTATSRPQGTTATVTSVGSTATARSQGTTTTVEDT